jgi:hypothetical protein
MMAMLLSSDQAHPVDLSEAVRTRHAKDAHARNQAGLSSMFKALPKNENGNLGLPAARYALHRLFEHRHRWFVRGLNPKSKAENSHVVGKAMQQLAAFDQKGLSLPALAALAGTLEELINVEATSHVGDLFKARGLSLDEAVPGETVRQLIQEYMTIYISGSDFRNNTRKDIISDDKFMVEQTRGWEETLDWVKSTTLEAAAAESDCSGKDMADCSFDFKAAVSMMKTVVEKYGFFNDNECHKVKTKLLGHVERRTGRVRLPEFYKAGLEGAWEFNEKIDYLRSLGTLDESTEGDPKVIVPNYVSSWVNCLSSSQFYSVCCRNECEDYMRVMEKHIAGPMADPDKIIRVVETQNPFIIDSPPNLAGLRHRLVSIAERHHGKVPIHGRLFAQWMHHAFPSTCPFPHEAGTTNPQTPDEWIAETGHTDIKASQSELDKVVAAPTLEMGQAPAEEAGELPWSEVEELLVVRAPPVAPKAKSGLVENLITLGEVALVVALTVVVMWMATQHRRMRQAQSKGHHY